MVITSETNDHIKRIKALMEKGKSRRKEGAFIVEGVKMTREISSDKNAVIYVSESFRENSDEFSEAFVISDKIFKKITDTVTPQGVLAIVPQKKYALDEILDCEKGCLVILDRLQDPGNLGTIIRTGEAAGIKGIIMSKDSVDIYNPKVVRSTMGAIFRVPFYVCDNLEDAISDIKRSGFKCMAAHLDGQVISKMDWPEKTAFMIGNESSGLSDKVSCLADERIKIPMDGQVESLNASVAASILMYSHKLNTMV